MATRTWKYVFLYTLVLVCLEPEAGFLTNKHVNGQPFEVMRPVDFNWAPVEYRNYVKRQSILTQITNESEIQSLADNELNESISYYDGLGKLRQSIEIRNSPNKRDNIKSFFYNTLGIQDIELLSYASDSRDGGFQLNILADLGRFYQSAQDVPHTRFPYSTTIHEKSSLLRVLEQGTAGETWQPVKITPSGGHTVKTKYRTNDHKEVRMWYWDMANTIKADQFYNSGELLVTETEDGNGHVVIEYKDKRDKVVLKRTFNFVDRRKRTLDTYYVYDDFGDLRFIVPPKAISEMKVNNNWLFKRKTKYELITEFIYDGYHRIIEKRAPGSEPVNTIYDKLGRPILLQDGKLREEKDWLFTKYDILGRPVLTGIYHYEGTSFDSISSLQRDVDDFVNNYSTFLYEKGTNENYDDQQGYTNQAFPQDDLRLLTISYYDDYDFDYNGQDDVTFTPDSELTEDFPDWKPFNRLQGKVTGVKTRILPPSRSLTPQSGGNSTWLKTVNFYDKYGRTIQTDSINIFGSKNLLSKTYDFSGKIQRSKLRHSFQNDIVTIRRRYTYDHAGRLLRVYQQNNDNPEVLVTQNVYNELGIMVEKNLHSENNERFLQSVDYEYNIRGWLSQINQPGDDHLQSDDSGVATTDLFYLKLWYENKDNHRLKNTPQYNGNISAVEWMVFEQLLQPLSIVNKPKPVHSYTYSYDWLSQLTKAYYRGARYVYDRTSIPDRSPLSFPVRPRKVSLHELYNMVASYDFNGNIKHVKRNGKMSKDTSGNSFEVKAIDDLTYYFEGNQLTGVDDKVPESHGYDFYDKNDSKMSELSSSGDAEYEYDANGNMVSDLNKAIKVTYNYMNLPCIIDFDDGGKIEWVYSASGEKLSKYVYDVGNQLTKKIFYIGNFVYENGVLDFFTMDEGRVKRLGDGTLRYEYNLTDHLGNVRVSFTKGRSGLPAGVPVILQENHYYPFGMKLAGLSKVKKGKGNKFAYNGMELEDEHGLNWYHYGARYYDPQLGRWHTIDLTDEFYSPYAYVGNNPIAFIDPDGNETISNEDNYVYMIHNVRPGDTISKIAKAKLGSYGDHNIILKHNPQIADNPDLIYPGNKIRIPIGSFSLDESSRLADIAELQYELTLIKVKIQDLKDDAFRLGSRKYTPSSEVAEDMKRYKTKERIAEGIEKLFSGGPDDGKGAKASKNMWDAQDRRDIDQDIEWAIEDQSILENILRGMSDN